MEKAPAGGGKPHPKSASPSAALTVATATATRPRAQHAAGSSAGSSTARSAPPSFGSSARHVSASPETSKSQSTATLPSPDLAQSPDLSPQERDALSVESWLSYFHQRKILKRLRRLQRQDLSNDAIVRLSQIVSGSQHLLEAAEDQAETISEHHVDGEAGQGTEKTQKKGKQVRIYEGGQRSGPDGRMNDDDHVYVDRDERDRDEERDEGMDEWDRDEEERDEHLDEHIERQLGQDNGRNDGEHVDGETQSGQRGGLRRNNDDGEDEEVRPGQEGDLKENDGLALGDGEAGQQQNESRRRDLRPRLNNADGRSPYEGAKNSGTATGSNVARRKKKRKQSVADIIEPASPSKVRRSSTRRTAGSTPPVAASNATADPPASPTPMVDPAASGHVTADPVASPTPMVDPAASDHVTADPPVSPTPVVNPAASRPVTTSPPASRNTTADPAASPTPTVDPAASSAPTTNPDRLDEALQQNSISTSTRSTKQNSRDPSEPAQLLEPQQLQTPPRSSSKASTSKLTTTPAHPQHDWGAIMRLKRLEIPQAISDYMDNHKSNADQFLLDPDLIRLARLVSSSEHSSGGGKQGLTFSTAVRFKLTSKLTRTDRTLTSACRVFLYLSWADALDLIDRSSTGRRLGAGNKAKFKDLLKAMQEDFMTEEAAWKELEQFLRRGRKLQRFADRYGLGSLLIFAPVLSTDFLDTKSPEEDRSVTMVTEHIQGVLRIDELTPEVEELAQNLRELLRRPFVEASQSLWAQTATPGTPKAEVGNDPAAEQVNEEHLKATPVDEEHFGETHVDEERFGETHVDEERFDETHVDETHVDETHVDETHVDEEHVDEEHVDEEHVDEEHVSEEHAGEDHVEEDKMEVEEEDQESLEDEDFVDASG
ncbi:hypothetical protein KC326_g8873 [Hortaea werneckii]|nr:hypothetical protein KC326_g8873 [Hortaea werneckii]